MKSVDNVVEYTSVNSSTTINAHNNNLVLHAIASYYYRLAAYSICSIQFNCCLFSVCSPCASNL